MLQGFFQTSWASTPQEVGIQDTLGSLVLAGASFACDTVGSAQKDVQANVHLCLLIVNWKCDWDIAGFLNDATERSVKQSRHLRGIFNHAAMQLLRTHPERKLA